jgi:hypothetical protein
MVNLLLYNNAPFMPQFLLGANSMSCYLRKRRDNLAMCVKLSWRTIAERAVLSILVSEST